MWGRKLGTVLLMGASSARRLAVVPAPEDDSRAFDDALRAHGLGPLVRGRVTTLQVNVGRLCNMACHHCHVDAGPERTEVMARPVAERIVEIVVSNPGIEVVDLTGGAPELCPSFRFLVRQIRALGRGVVDRCNLTVLFDPRAEGIADFMAEQGVHIVASLPCYLEENVDGQRGGGAFEKSIAALIRLNTLGYGRADSGLTLDLVYNPVGASLPPDETRLEAKYRNELDQRFGINFNRLLTITNMPIQRFAAALERRGEHEAYMSLLVNHFNPHTVPTLMCRSLLSVAWDGRLFDCDFNQALDIKPGPAHAQTIWDVTSLDALVGRPIATGRHCFGCTAGRGSSCGGALTS